MVKTIPFDPAKYLDTPEGQAELLSDALASGNAAYVVRALGIIADARDVKIFGEESDPRLTTLLGVMRALGVTLTAQIEPAD